MSYRFPDRGGCRVPPAGPFLPASPQQVGPPPPPPPGEDPAGGGFFKMRLAWWMAPGVAVTMRRDGRWFDQATGASSRLQPRFGIVYRIAAAVGDGAGRVHLALSGFPGTTFDAREFRPAAPLKTEAGMAALRRIVVDASSDTMAVTLSEFEGWG